jgi:hypothetical protein
MTAIEVNLTNISNHTISLSNIINATINETSLSSSSVTPVIKQIHDILIVILLICVMFSMGCSVTLEQVSEDFSFFLKLVIIDSDLKF